MVKGQTHCDLWIQFWPYNSYLKNTTNNKCCVMGINYNFFISKVSKCFLAKTLLTIIQCQTGRWWVRYWFDYPNRSCPPVWFLADMLQAVHNTSLDTHGCKLQLELFADYNNSLALIPISVGCPDLNPCYLNNKLPLVVTRSSLKTFQVGKYICSLILISPNFMRRPANQG